MKTGLLWFNDNPSTQLEEKITRAATHYQHKHGRPPDLCYVHPTALGDNKAHKIGDVEIRTGRSVLPHHFWLGLAEKQPAQKETQL